MRGKTRDMVIAALAARKPFKTGGSLHAIEGAASGCGRMPYDVAAEYRADKIAYTVISYGTPIAWVTTDGEVKIPDEGYSATTRAQLTIVRAYL